MDGVNLEAESSGANNYLVQRKIIFQKILDGEDCTEWYDRNAEVYDKEYEKVEFLYPADITAEFANVVPDRNSRVLDVGAGSGRLGTLLKGKGYKNIDALDGSKGMVELLQTKDIYSSSIFCRVDSNKVDEIDDETYDGIVMGAVLGRGHVDFEALPSILRMIKKGGYLVFNLQHWFMQFPGFSRETLTEKFNHLESKQLARIISEKPTEVRKGEMASLFTVQRGQAEFA